MILHSVLCLSYDTISIRGPEHMIDYIFTFCAFAIFALCVCGILVTLFNNVFRPDKW
ncbi:MAG: hypothetical protein H6Q72_562 [Firmicutes bacterium]|nr:hypothetical protein [Bacillota bacterium]